MSVVFERVVALAATRPGRSLRTSTEVELVTGPPGSGKSTLVMERKVAGDAVVDLDRLVDALLCGAPKTPHVVPAAQAARDAAVYALASEPCVPRVWVIACAPTERERHWSVVPFARARITVLEVPPEECLRRIEVQARGDDLCPTCDEWHLARSGNCKADRLLIATDRPNSTDWPALVYQWWREYRRPVATEQWSEVEVVT